MLKQFSYQLDAGPFLTEKELSADWNVGNCRRALQLYFLASCGLFLTPKEVLCPDAYYRTGEFIFKNGEKISFSTLRAGDIIYAERIRNKGRELIDKSEKIFTKADDYIISLHTAIYTNKSDKEIWHATASEGGSCYWSLENFLYFYKPIAIKRITTSATRI